MANRALFGKFVDFVTSQRKEEAIAFWLNQLEGLPRYDLLFKPSMNREFITSPNEVVLIWIYLMVEHSLDGRRLCCTGLLCL